MKRAEIEADQMPGQDSFLDVITNIVGILILLVLVVGLRTSHSVRGETDELLADQAHSEQEFQQAYRNALNTQRDVRNLVGRVGNAHLETQFRESERAWLGTAIVEAEKEIEARRQKLSTNDQRDFDLRHKIALAQAKLDDLTREQVALISRGPPTESLECQPTPVSQAVTGKEIHVLLSEDHLVVVPFDSLMEQMKSDAQANVWRLRTQDQMQRTIGPISGFRLKYYFVKEGLVGRNAAGDYMAGQAYKFSHCHMLPEVSPPGEPAADALAANSEFVQQLQQHRPEGTTITIWTYPGNYERLREMKRIIRQMGFAIAVRPLPPGMPIGASRHGSNSLSE